MEYPGYGHCDKARNDTLQGLKITAKSHILSYNIKARGRHGFDVGYKTGGACRGDSEAS